MQDTRNVIDEFKTVPVEEIVDTLDRQDHGLVIALENIERDFNMGSIVRSANAFGVRHVYIIGRRQWNKRGAMATDKYLHVHYIPTINEFIKLMRQDRREIIAIDNTESSTPLAKAQLNQRAVLVFGQESNGISSELLKFCDKVVAIEQFGSTRSINVGAAAAVAIYAWVARYVLKN